MTFSFLNVDESEGTVPEACTVNNMQRCWKKAEAYLPPKIRAGEMWWCLGCNTLVRDYDVTFQERHDLRFGGCGGKCIPYENYNDTVATFIRENKRLADTCSRLEAELNKYREILIQGEAFDHFRNGTSCFGKRE
jgi:hypothetical protein